MPKKLLLSILLLVSLITAPAAWAQIKSVEVSDTYELADPDAKGGDILVLTDKGLVRSSIDYDAKMFGVVQENQSRGRC